MIHRLRTLSLIAIPLLFAAPANAQLKINEYSCANTTSVPDNFGNYEDWFELYNPGASAVNLAGMYLSDDAGNPTKWAIPSGSVSAGGFVKIFASGVGQVVGVNIHAGFKLTQCKPEQILIADATGNIVDSLTLRRNQENHSWARTTDGGATWGVCTASTPGMSNSGVLQGYATKPTLSQAPGFYPGSISVNITSPDAGVTIRYTTNGTEPTASSTAVSGPVNISATTVLRARAFSSNAAILPSFIESNTYFINVTHSVDIVSIYSDDLMTLMNGDWNSEPVTGFELFDKTSSHTFCAEATGNTNKHGNDSWAYDQRGIDFVVHDEFGYDYAVRYPIFRRTQRSKFQRLILKAAANDNYPFETGGAHIRDAFCHDLSQAADLHLDERSWEPCVLYCNGQYWGVYDLREKVDDQDYTDYYYNQPDQNNQLQFLMTWGGTWSQYGGGQAQTDWNAFVSFVTTNNMTTAANWHYVDSVYNWKSLADYVILNSYAVTSDWLNWNTGWWRGLDPAGGANKWRYILWDNDATFGHYINYTGIPDTSPNADPCNPETLPDPGGEGHIPILNKLTTNPIYQQWYVNRFIDLLNTSLQCDTVRAHLASMIGEIQPEMQGQCTRWSGSYATWQANVAALDNYIDARCTGLTQGFIDCYSLTGPYNITVDVQPPGSGEVDLNSIHLDQFTWSGQYFGGIPVILQATPTSSAYTFDHWGMSDSPTPSTTDDSVGVNLTQAQTITAYFKTNEILEDAFIPTAFSPNGDGTNDVYQLHGLEGASEINFVVYNRWGQRVFETTDPVGRWDGTMSGKMLNSGVYTYKLTAKVGDEVQLKTGNITLMH